MIEASLLPLSLSLGCVMRILTTSQQFIHRMPGIWKEDISRFLPQIDKTEGKERSPQDDLCINICISVMISGHH